MVADSKTEQLILFEVPEVDVKDVIKRRFSLFPISEELVYDTPNDQELGKKVREIYHELKKVI